MQKEERCERMLVDYYKLIIDVCSYILAGRLIVNKEMNKKYGK